MSLKGRSLVSINDLTTAELKRIVDLAGKMAEALGWDGGQRQPWRPLDAILATLFFEPSTRTRLSFEAAMLRLGGQVLGFADARVSSAAKGESLSDAARIVSAYCDIMVIRHPLAGSALVASRAASVPVINAGDGPREHPTQTLTDLFAIKRFKGRLDGLTVGLCGDLKYGRTVHSLAPTLARLGSRVVCIAPDSLQMPERVLAEVEAISGQRPELTDDLAAALPSLDVLYMTRIQRERFDSQEEYERVRGVYILTRELLQRAPEDMIVLHPLPRVDEIAPDVDEDPRAKYFEQAAGGVPVRMALISLLLGLEEPAEKPRHAFAAEPAEAAAQAAEDDRPKREEVPAPAPCRNAKCITSVEPNLPQLALKLADGSLVCRYCEMPFEG